MTARRIALILLVVFAAAPAAQAPRVTTPKEEFGFNFGDDYQLATYTQLTAYWQKLDRESDRMVLQEIGKTSEGRPHLMAIVTSPANHKNLARIRDTSRRLALADGLTDDQARALARDGKVVVWIDGGLHASEVLGRPAARRDGLPDGEPHRRRDDAVPRRYGDPVRARQPGRA